MLLEIAHKISHKEINVTLSLQLDIIYVYRYDGKSVPLLFLYHLIYFRETLQKTTILGQALFDFYCNLQNLINVF